MTLKKVLTIFSFRFKHNLIHKLTVVDLEMADKGLKKEPLTEIQKAAILKDNVQKITKHQKLYTKYFWNKYNTSKFHN